MPTRYFSFEHDDGPKTGLVREIKDDEGYTLERVRAGLWVDDPSLLRHFGQSGDSTLVAIAAGEAWSLASAYGVEL